MRAYQLFQAISPGLAAEVFRSLRESQRDIYKGVIISLAKDRRLRPVFVQRKPTEAQIDWLVKTSRLKGSDSVAEHVLQAWLLKAHQDLLIAFLDGMGIPHDGEGSVDDLPDELDEEKLDPAIQAILNGRPPELVATYLWVFQMQKPGGWPVLTRRLQEDERLRLSPAAKAEPDVVPPAGSPAGTSGKPVAEAVEAADDEVEPVASAAETEEA